MSDHYIPAPFTKGRENHTKAELNETATLAQSGDEAAKTALGEMMQPYVIAYLRRIKGDYTPEQRNEMTQTAWVGVYEALRRWDPEAGVKFNTHAYWWVHGEVQKWLAQNSGVISLPRQAWANVGRIEAAVLHQTNGEKMPYDLTDEELAEYAVRNRGGRFGPFPAAGDAVRARQQAYEVKDPEGGLGRSSQSAEADYLEESIDLDTEALAAIGFIREALDEGDEDMALTIAEDLVELCAAHGLDIPVSHIMDVAEGPA